LEVVAMVYGCLGLGSFEWVGVCWVDGGCLADRWLGESNGLMV